jgi:hypothetical protein
MFWLLVCIAVMDILAFAAWGARNKRSRTPRWSDPALTNRSSSRPLDPSRG